MINRRRMVEKVPPSSPSIDKESPFDRSEEASFDRPTYDELLMRWKLKGSDPLDKYQPQGWRDNMYQELKQAQSRSRSLILDQQLRDDRHSVGAAFSKADDDPLCFVNELGVPAFAILSILEEGKRRMDTYGVLEENLKDKEIRTTICKQIKKTAKMLREYETRFNDEMIEFFLSRSNRKVYINEFRGPWYPHWVSNGLRALSVMFKDPWDSQLLPPWTGRKIRTKNKEGKWIVSWENKAGPSSHESLRCITGCISAEWDNAEKNIATVYSDINVRRRLKWGAISAILVCAFPETIKLTDNRRAVRNIKDGYRKWFKYHDPNLELRAKLALKHRSFLNRRLQTKLSSSAETITPPVKPKSTIGR